MQAKPALLFSGTPWDFNYYEFFATVLAPLFQTAAMTGLLKEGETSSGLFMPFEWNADQGLAYGHSVCCLHLAIWSMVVEACWLSMKLALLL